MKRLLIFLTCSLAFLITFCGPLAAVAAESAVVVFSGNAPNKTGLCRGDNLGDVRNCAIAQCRDNGAAAPSCQTIRSCVSAGWSFQLTMVRNSNGYVWEDFHCGFASQSAALRVKTLFCAMRAVDASCALSRLISPAGEEMPIK